MKTAGAAAVDGGAGLDSAVEEGIIIDLTSYVETYTPNYIRFLDA